MVVPPSIKIQRNFLNIQLHYIINERNFFIVSKTQNDNQTVEVNIERNTLKFLKLFCTPNASILSDVANFFQRNGCILVI